MPQLDMPIKELEVYRGISPKPADFDAYWERALKEMRETAPNPEEMPSDFQLPEVSCSELFFTGVGGARIHVKHLHPRNKEKAPAVLFFHGYGDSSGNWFGLLPYVAAGFGVFAMDCRGQGMLSTDPGGVCGNTLNGHLIRGLEETNPDKLMYRQLFLDAAELASLVFDRPEVDTDSVFATGGSQGGALSLVCAALEARIRKVAVQNPFLCDFKRVWELDRTETSYAELKQFFRDKDPMHLKHEIVFEKLGYIDVQNFADRIRAKVLMGTGLMDMTTPASAQYAVYNKIQSPKRHLIYPDYGHETLANLNDEILQFFVQP